MSYKYWNDFINVWRALPTSEYTNPIPTTPHLNISGWTNPNSIGLLGSKKACDYSLQYIPEPWWGNDGIHPLESVVINYNPGEGGGIQHHIHSSGLFGFPDNNVYMNDEVITKGKRLKETYMFHKVKRAARVLNTLKRATVSIAGESLEYHLSIELIPWHTKDIKMIKAYTSINLFSILNYSLLFAAAESKRIINSTLKNKVIVRIAGNEMKNLLDEMVHAKLITYSMPIPSSYTYKGLVPSVPNGKGGFMKFIIDAKPNVEFICIWGTGKTHNDFPTNADMDWIFTNII